MQRKELDGFWGTCTSRTHRTVLGLGACVWAQRETTRSPCVGRTPPPCIGAPRPPRPCGSLSSETRPALRSVCRGELLTAPTRPAGEERAAACGKHPALWGSGSDAADTAAVDAAGPVPASGRLLEDCAFPPFCGRPSPTQLPCGVVHRLSRDPGWPGAKTLRKLKHRVCSSVSPW